jgi:tetratricopeptide (TPR) repeat protein
MPRRKRLTTLLLDLQSRHTAARRGELGAALPSVAEELIERLASESEQQRRRFTVLRRSDVLGESHAQIARDVGLSRSQFYRDLQDARERLAAELESAFSVRAATPGYLQPGVAARRVTIEALRNGGRFDRAREAATTCVREAEPAEAVDVLCLRAELETECGDFPAAQETTAQARALLPRIAENRLRDLLTIACDLADFESGHCAGRPASAALRDGRLAELRVRHASGDHDYGSPLVRALVAEASLLFAQGDEFRALALIEEASALVRREPSIDARLAVDVQVRISGLHALRPDALSAALEEAARIVDAGMRWRDARTLRLGLQSASAHLLTLGRLDEAKEYALQALWLIDFFGGPLDRVIVLSNLARIDVHRRDGAQALRWIGLARSAGCDAFPITQAIAISEAEALALVDQPGRAVDAARAAADRVHDWPRLHARAKLAEAIALSTVASSREAMWCSNEAVELARVAGGPLVELRALDLNVKLTGDARSKRALRDLRAALSPAPTTG